MNGTELVEMLMSNNPALDRESAAGFAASIILAEHIEDYETMLSAIRTALSYAPFQQRAA